MKLNDIIKEQDAIVQTVDWIEQKTNEIYYNFEKIEDCYTQECDEEREELQQQMSFYLNKLKVEEKNIDSTQEKFYAYSGSNE